MSSVGYSFEHTYSNFYLFAGLGHLIICTHTKLRVQLFPVYLLRNCSTLGGLLFISEKLQQLASLNKITLYFHENLMVIKIKYI